MVGYCQSPNGKDLGEREGRVSMVTPGELPGGGWGRRRRRLTFVNILQLELQPAAMSFRAQSIFTPKFLQGDWYPDSLKMSQFADTQVPSRNGIDLGMT